MSAQARNSGTLNFGIIGCGAIGPTHAGAIGQIDGARLLAVADSILDRAKSVAQKFQVDRVYRSDREVIADADIDVVVVCTPSGMHADHAVAALAAGKHVIVEKPMDVTTEACDRMIRAQRESGRKLTIISQHRFDKASQIVKKAIDGGRLGRIILADASVRWWRTQGYYDSGDWRGTWKFDGGGALMNQGIHTVDVLQWLAGPVSSVFARTLTGAHEKIEVEDVAVASLTFASGAVGTLTATTAAYPGFPVRIDLYGTDGSAVLEGDRLHTLAFKNGETFTSQRAAAHALSVARGGTASVKDEAAARDEAKEDGEVWGDAHRAQIEDFIRAIQTDTSPFIDGPAGRRPVQIIRAIYESARSCAPVSIT